MTDFLAALGLVLAFEGLVIAAFPGAWRRAMEAVLAAPEGPMRLIGLVVGALGVLIVYVVRVHLV
ncbi:DUF2065 domain-containing protein [Xanthobacter tagetidis]|jgi:uncharacterized protein YjeT (DUF2065 family)|uniref:DUF2065 domain-containing protein n=1 Tax=Xanthobacter tagetidis TaxID=60216 RepID=A0A3L7AKC9_9HYPH|nr:DUF2065 domain-containing protein [Xanthobacter tagetidis]MBB6309029.1 hypothetical protein [Xanthobacter tagetidis]RLP80474.1 DUF2065 domain-containing protein [Xanthobacter tagetidis]